MTTRPLISFRARRPITSGKILFLALMALPTIPYRIALAELPGHWQRRAPMPSARTEVAAVELGGKIYVIGGYEKGGNLIEEYDPGTDRKSTRLNSSHRT